MKSDDVLAVAQMVEQGSPLLVNAVGRVFGVGPLERKALGSDGIKAIPSWVWIVTGFGAGFIIGARLQNAWPDKMPKLISGRRK